MKLKTLIVTVLVLTALSAVVYVVNRPAPPVSADTRINQPIISAAAVDAASKIKISDQGKSVLLAKAADGSWQVASYFDFPADFQKLSTFVNELTSAKVEQYVTANPDRVARLEFKDTKIELLDAAEKPTWTLTLGKNAEAGGRFVRFGEEAKAYRANLNAWLDPEAKNWAEASLLPVKPEDIARVEIDFPGGAPVLATRAKKEDAFAAANPPTGQKLKTDKITSLVSSLTGLRFSDTNETTDANAVAAKQNPRNVKLTTFDGKTWTVALGRKPEQKIVKPPTPKADGKTGPAALGPVTDSAKPTPIAPQSPGDATKDGPAKIAEPETETIPAGPVYAFVANSDTQARINALMAKRSFQVYEYAFTSLPQKVDELFEPAPPTPPVSAAPAPAAPPAPAAK